MRAFKCSVAIVLLAVSSAAFGVDAPADLYFDSDGVKIHYTMQGKGKPLVLIHGFTASIDTNWRAPGIIEALANDFQVIAVDARGHGKSDKPHEPAAYGPRMGEDVIRLLDHLGIMKAHIAGYSMGGAITLQLLTTYPDRFLSAVLGGSGWQPPGGASEKLMMTLADSLEQGKGIGPLVVALNPVGQPMPTPEAIAATNQRLMGSNDALALAAVIRGSASNRPVTREALQRNRVPALVVVGETDPVRATVDVMAGLMGNLEVKVLPGRDHLTAVADPGLASSMRDFLLRH
jgi:pimeloyl-ACP methyl ester carboxylesterase